MSPSITQEAKDALVEALKKMKTANFNTRPDDESSSDFAYRVAIEIIESFPVSDGWITVEEKLPEENVFKTVLASD